MIWRAQVNMRKKWLPSDSTRATGKVDVLFSLRLIVAFSILRFTSDSESFLKIININD